MAPSRAFGMSSSSASSRHANRARAASDEEEYSDADNHYRAIKKATASAVPSKSSLYKSSASAPSRAKRPSDEVASDYDHTRAVKKSASSTHKSGGSSKATRHGNEESSDVEGDDPAASALSEELLMDTRGFGDYVDKKLSKLASKREQMLEERLERLKSQRDEIQAQYDELRQLRYTDPEQVLDDFKKTAEARYRHDKDLISSLKVKVEAAEKRAKEAEGGVSAPGGADRSMSILNASVMRESVQPELSDQRIEELEKQHRKEMAEAIRTQKRLEEDVRAYKLQLEQEIAQSKANGAKASSAATATSAASASLAALEDEKAVRKLYEDLTGLVVTGVERIEAHQPFRRFKAIFAQEDYYSVLMDLEESSSKISSTSGAAGKSQTRDDIVYVPKIDEDRDSELLNSQLVPQEWLDALRFDRNMLFKWYEKTRKALLTDEARMKIRAREERAARH
ncbi:hypothetical protein EX895_006215 [Sporisorium graminicola]|uniref:Monopolin complex subunit Csm1/Pcs1 C-terminal domain-containing protein n=1 Tax=Sporisorium graminicola TaxID=280036 RepID=A0A4U7KLH4_9BASI|nr:hypothetical protein EX895_006215 [Sporisorium graminicola]TKY85135.1 hypothetical protein EX895_006215 [Sporisorium graminicola]